MWRLKATLTSPRFYAGLSAATTLGIVFYMSSPPRTTNDTKQATSIRSDKWVSANADDRQRSWYGHHDKHQDLRGAKLMQAVKEELQDIGVIDVAKDLIQAVEDTLEHEIEQDKEAVEHIRNDVENELVNVADSMHEAAADISQQLAGTVSDVKHEAQPTAGKIHPAAHSAAKDFRHEAQAQAQVTKQEAGQSQIDLIEVDYLLVGGGTASYSAMLAIKDVDADARVLIVSDEEHLPYMRPPLSKELWTTNHDTEHMQQLTFSDWGGTERSIFYEGVQKYTDAAMGQSVMVMSGRRVTDLHVDAHYATLENGQRIKYKKVLLATGGSPKHLPELGEIPLQLASTYRTLDDFKHLSDMVKAIAKDKRILIVGGGFLGSELACALARHDKSIHVTQCMPENGNMGLVFPQYLAKWTQKRVEHEGVAVLPITKITSATVGTDGSVLDVTFSNSTKAQYDHVVQCVGIEPNVELARKAGLELDDKRGGVLVNSELEARGGVFVAGDAASFHDVVLGRRRIEHHDHAILSGRLAGRNMASKTHKEYKHQSMLWSDLGPSIGYEAVGILDAKLKTVGLWAQATKQDTPADATDTDNIRSADPQQLTEADPVSVHVATEPVVHKAEVDAERDLSEVVQESSKDAEQTKEEPQFGKGVVLYLDQDRRIVGVLMWNIFNRSNIARRLIADRKSVQDVKNLALLFNIHE